MNIWTLLFKTVTAIYNMAGNFGVLKSNPWVISKYTFYVRLGMMWTSHASSGNTGKFSRHGFLDCVVYPFGDTAWMGGPMIVDGRYGASTYE